MVIDLNVWLYLCISRLSARSVLPFRANHWRTAPFLPGRLAAEKHSPNTGKMLGRRSFAGRRGASPCVVALRFRAYRDQSVQAAHALTFAGLKLNSGTKTSQSRMRRCNPAPHASSEQISRSILILTTKHGRKNERRRQAT
ncbi:hypothetical protein [Bradyrhizobium elkanii]|uniref:hypothetical protein n=1 Tax=Bradyrhizobium elkanii TaxID=29448 RepID=UPI001BADFEC6|nr:hypothetical protein [Bradyrhizobium elkanii]MBR1159702.1 hypothetical protein [Bradyrhizobium elkanii]